MVKFVIVLSAIVSCVLGASIPTDVITRQLDGRIVGGQATSIQNYPWTVSVQIYGEKTTKQWEHVCGGAIYSGNIIITAAHCLQGDLKSYNLRVRVGSNTWNYDGALYYAFNFKYHQLYNPTTLANDIAVIRLSAYLNLNSATTKPIPLATLDPSNGASAVVTGWGATSYEAAQPLSTLQFVNVNIIGRSQCSSTSYGYSPQKIDQSMICAAAVGKDACQGDSGGPLVSNGYLVGIVSWGYGCANGYFPGVYADIANLRQWIISNA